MYKSGSSDAAREELRNRFEREKRQFDDGLPVYAAKEEVRHGAWRQTCHIRQTCHRARLSARVIRSSLSLHASSLSLHASSLSLYASSLFLHGSSLFLHASSLCRLQSSLFSPTCVRS